MAKKRDIGDVRKVIGYVRVSTDDQDLSVAAQRKDLEGWCQAKGAVLVSVFVDEGVSGAAPIEKRLGLIGALAAVTEHGCGTLLATRRDRVARGTFLAGIIDRLARDRGARVRTVQGDYEEETPETELMRQIADVLAQYERAVISVRTIAALAEKKRRGQRIGSVPFGQRLVAGSKSQLEDDPHEQAVLAAIKRYYVDEKMPMMKMGRRLWLEGLRPRTGKPWTPDAMGKRLVQLGVRLEPGQ